MPHRYAGLRNQAFADIPVSWLATKDCTCTCTLSFMCWALNKYTPADISVYVVGGGREEGRGAGETGTAGAGSGEGKTRRLDMRSAC